MTILERAVSKMQQLPIDKQQEALSFIEFLAFKLGDRQVREVPKTLTTTKHLKPKETNFWNALQKFRLTIENEGFNFGDEDFAGLRDRSVGQEIIL
jgi:hypothetical protein